MSCITYTFPHKTVFGSGTARNLIHEIPAGIRLLTVAGKTISGTPSAGKLLEGLAPFTAAVYTGVPAEPPLNCVDELISLGRRHGVGGVVAIGGGSVIDAAKAAAALIPLEGSVADYFSGNRTIPGKGLFFAALPSTAGTGAESTNNAVLTDSETKIKKSLRHPSMIADVAIVDPELTLTCPPALTAASGLDAFVQAFESFTSPRASALTRSLSAEAVRKITASLETVFRNPDDLRFRSEMAEASMLSGLAFAQTGLGAVHGIAHPVGSLLGVPHGLACAILMKPVTEFNIPVCGDRYAELADRAFLGTDAQAFLRTAEELARKLNVPDNLRAWDFRREHFEFIIRNCRSASMKQNPREMSDADVAAILEQLL